MTNVPLTNGIGGLLYSNNDIRRLPRMDSLMPVGTTVTSTMPGRETGTIIAINRNRSGYDGYRYPYVVVWEDGYKDFYGCNSFETAYI